MKFASILSLLALLIVAAVADVSEFDDIDNEIEVRDLKGKGSKSSKGSAAPSCLKLTVLTEDIPANTTAFAAPIYVKGKNKPAGTFYLANLAGLLQVAFSFRKGKRQLFGSGTVLNAFPSDLEFVKNPIYAGSGAYAGATGTWEILKEGNKKIVYSVCT